MRYGSAPARKHDLSSLERVFCAGEVLNAPAWEWLQKEALHRQLGNVTADTVEAGRQLSRDSGRLFDVTTGTVTRAA